MNQSNSLKFSTIKSLRYMVAMFVWPCKSPMIESGVELLPST